MIKHVKKLAWMVLKPYARWQLQRTKECSDVDHLMTRVFSRFNTEFQPVQSQWELKHFLLKVQQAEPRRVMEIGTYHGGVFLLLVRVSAQDGVFISIDLPGGIGGDDKLDKNIPIIHKFAAPAQSVHFLRKDSHRPETMEMARDLLRGRQLDLLFIDGDHSYQGVKRDYELYSPLVRSGGLIGFHDIMLDKEPQYGAARFWREIKPGNLCEEIVEDKPGTSGIGVLTVR